MRIIDVLWIEDDPEFVDGHLTNFKEDREELGITIVPWHYLSKEDFEKNAHHELEALAMEVAIIDNNLPGVNGNEIVKEIRSFQVNKNIPIVFYSAARNALELQQIIEETFGDETPENIYYCHKDDLVDTLLPLLE